MNIDEIEIELDKEKEDLIQEIIELQKQIEAKDLERMNDNLFKAIQSKTIETITMALGVSQILEDTNFSFNGLQFDKEYKEYQKWENSPKGERSSTYQTKHVPKNEFKKMLKSTEKLVYNRDDLTGKEYNESMMSQRERNPDGFTDAYTGKMLKHGENYHYEHVLSTQEISQDRALNHLTSIEERRHFANSDSNLVTIDGKLNQSLSKIKKDDIEKWENKTTKKDPSKTNKEFFGTDSKKVLEVHKKSNEAREKLLISKEVKIGMSTQAKMAGLNGLKSGLRAAVGQLLSITVVEVINEYRKKEGVDFKQKIANVTLRIKEKASDIFKTFTEHSIGSFISTFLQAILESLFKIAKSIFKFIKTAIVSIFKALKVLFSKESSWEERSEEALKILGLAVSTLIGLALEELIEKAFVASFPFLAPFAGFISPVLAGLVVGIGSVLVLQGFQKYQSNIEFRKLKASESELIRKISNNSLTQVSISDTRAIESMKVSFQVFAGLLPLIESYKFQIEESFASIRIQSAEIDRTNLQTESIILENNDLLDLYESI
jgi:hypothetical protein